MKCSAVPGIFMMNNNFVKLCYEIAGGRRHVGTYHISEREVSAVSTVCLVCGTPCAVVGRGSFH